MKILITGGTGFIGSHTALELIKAGHEPIILDNLCNSSIHSLEAIEKLTATRPSFYNCDVRNKEGLASVFETNKPEAVIHFAGLKAVGESSKIPLDYYDNNIGGAVTLCEVMAEKGVKKLIFSSSATVYGAAGVSPLVEESSTGGTTNPYGNTKYFIEQILRDVAGADKDWRIVSLRYFNPVGADESGEMGEDPAGIPNNLMPFIAKTAVGELPCLTVYGNDYPTRDGTCVRDYIHVTDLALGHIAALKKLEGKDPGQGEVTFYNLGTGHGSSVLEVISAFERASGRKVNYKIGSRRAGDLAELVSNPAKIEKELGWKASRDLLKMCEDSWRWQHRYPKGFAK